MPTTPVSTKCRELGCKNPKTYRSAFCQQHGGAAPEQVKENAKLYNQAAWKRIRARQLSQHPLCARCLSMGKVASAEHVDHVFPHRRDSAKFIMNLFQSLCASCHTEKGQDEMKGKYLHYLPTGVVEYTDDDYVRMMDMHYR